MEIQTITVKRKSLTQNPICIICRKNLRNKTYFYLGITKGNSPVRVDNKPAIDYKNDTWTFKTHKELEDSLTTIKVIGRNCFNKLFNIQ